MEQKKKKGNKQWGSTEKLENVFNFGISQKFWGTSLCFPWKTQKLLKSDCPERLWVFHLCTVPNRQRGTQQTET